MAATTSADLAALIPSELISGVLIQNMGDRANLKDLCAVRTGFKSYEFAELAPLTAVGVAEGAALTPAVITPVGTVITASPQEIPAIQVTRLALECQQGPDWLNLSGALGKGLSNRANAQICATFDDTFNANRNVCSSTDGAGNAIAMDLHTLELAIEVAEGNNSMAQPFGGAMGLVAVLHPSQIAAIRANVRTSGNYVTREDILAVNPALPATGLAFGYYNVAIYSSMGVTSSAFVQLAGAGVELQTGLAIAAGTTKKGALFSVGEGVGFVMQKDANIRTQESVLIGSGGMNLIAGYVGAAGRISEALTVVQSL